MLNSKQIKQTRIELNKNFELSGIAPKTIEKDLGFTSRELEAALELKLGHNPTNVWKLRDYLEEKICKQGKEPVPFSVLTHNIYYPYERDWN